MIRILYCTSCCAVLNFFILENSGTFTYYADKTLLTQVLFLLSLQILFLVSISVSWITSQSGQQFYLSFKVCKNLLALHNVNIRRNYVMMIAWQLAKEQLKRLITPFFTWVCSLWLHHLSIYQEKLLFMR